MPHIVFEPLIETSDQLLWVLKDSKRKDFFFCSSNLLKNIVKIEIKSKFCIQLLPDFLLKSKQCSLNPHAVSVLSMCIDFTLRKNIPMSYGLCS